MTIRIVLPTFDTSSLAESPDLAVLWGDLAVLWDEIEKRESDDEIWYQKYMDEQIYGKEDEPDYEDMKAWDEYLEERNDGLQNK